jgi:hypothetical protein
MTAFRLEPPLHIFRIFHRAVAISHRIEDKRTQNINN